VMEQKPSEITAALDEFLGPYLFPDKGDGTDPRLCPKCAVGSLALRGGKFGPFIACSNYPDCKFTRKFAQPGGGGEDNGPEVLGTDPVSGEEVSKRSGRFGPYVQLGEGKEAKRSSIPKDIPGEDFDLDYALRLLALPREVGSHPESGKPILAGLGRYGPYLLHDGKYAKLTGTAEIFEIGMNAAVTRIAEAANGGGRAARGSAAPLAVFGPHPTSGGEMKLMAGRFGPYVTDGTTNATLPKTADPDAMTAEEAVALIDARAAKGPPAKGKKKAAAKKKAPAKKAASRNKATTREA
jgi:DNA topoisomerase I